MLILGLKAKSDFDIDKCRGLDIQKSEESVMSIKECLAEANGAKKLGDVPAEKLPVRKLTTIN
jgi:hypothetical protein